MENNYYKYRVKYTKGEEIKFIGHLDVMRLFQRAIRRAALPVAYSQGFNPHQLLSFASPLSLGMTSHGEYGDFVMQQPMEEDVFIQKLNEVLPRGVHVLTVTLLPPKADNAMASVDAAEFDITLPVEFSAELLQEKLPLFLAQKDITVLKKTKNGQKMENIRPDIFNALALDSTQEKGLAQMRLFLSSGSRRNLKASLVMESLYQFSGLEWNPYRLAYDRLDLYAAGVNGYLSLDGKNRPTLECGAVLL